MIEENINLVHDALTLAKKCKLEPEFVCSIMDIMRSDPNLTDREVIIQALREWDIE